MRYRPAATAQAAKCINRKIYPSTLVTELALFAAPTPQQYAKIVIRFMKKVTVAMARSMIVGQIVVGVTQGCTPPSITWLRVRKYFARAYERVPIIMALRIREAEREKNRRIRMRFLYAWDFC
jgi:hypothetical protein